MPGINIFKSKHKVNHSVPTYLELRLTECHHREGITVPKEAFPYIREAMKDFAAWNIREYRKKERNDMLWVFANLPRIFLLTRWKVQKLLVRKRFFNLAKKEAIARANSEGYKVYVVRDSEFRFKTISTLDFKYAKSIKVFKKDIDAKEMERTASYIAYPKDAPGTAQRIEKPHQNTNRQAKKKRTAPKRNNQPGKSPANFNGMEKEMRTKK